MSDLRPKLNRLERLIGTPEERCWQCGAPLSQVTVWHASEPDGELRSRCLRCGAHVPPPTWPVKAYAGVPIGKDKGAP